MTERDERLVELMVKASGLTRAEVIAKWFATGTFKSVIGCGFGSKK